MIVIGLVGEKRGGKGTFTRLLAEILPHAKIIRLGFGDIVGDILDILDMPRTRNNMQKLPVGLMTTFDDPAVITNAMRHRIGVLDADIVILDGIRTFPDREMLGSFPRHLLVYVTASVETRYQRAVQAAEKIGDAKLTFEQFLAQDNAEIERLIPAIGAKADYVIQNESTLNDYRDHVKRVQRYFITPAE